MELKISNVRFEFFHNLKMVLEKNKKGMVNVTEGSSYKLFEGK